MDEGIALIRAEIGKGADDSDKASHYRCLIRLGLVLDRPELTNEASEALLKILIAEIEGGDNPSSYSYNNVLDAQAHAGDWQAVVDAYGEILAAYQKTDAEPSRLQTSATSMKSRPPTSPRYTCSIRRTRFQQGSKRPAAQPRVTQKNSSTSSKSPPPANRLSEPSTSIPCEAAGMEKEAIAFSLHLLARNRGTDAFYEKAIALDKDGATKFIQSLRKYDPYEERPLIWLAEITRRDGDLELAMKTIEQAIALDPSDGDHGKETRMFCYEILARIHADTGNQERAEFFRDVTDSIRQGEAADDFLAAGLIKQATDRYEKALGQFADAYCLQSRLAMTLARNGKFDKAVAHFEKAFELMPVSFGPRESHCFGCEGLFSDERVIDIALPLLTAFEEKNPDNPRTPYLLGLMLSEKKEHQQAAIAFRRALELDPSYFNAASKLLGILEKDPERFDEAEKLRSQIFEIAPYPAKPKYLANPSKLRSYWETCEKFPESPLALPEIPFTAPVPEVKEQYLEFDEFRSSVFYSNFGDDAQALDGWSASELRRSNMFLDFLSDLD